MRKATGKITNYLCKSGAPHPRGGFTLVELLIAVTVSAIVMTAAAFALSSGMRAYARIAVRHCEERSNPVVELNFFRAFQSDISSAVPLNDILFSGDSKTMSFSRLASPTHSTNNIVVTRVEWKITPDRGAVRTLTWYGDGVPPSRTDTFAVAPQGFEYRGENALQWQDTWAFTNYPAQVRLGETVFTIWSSNYTNLTN